MTSIPVADILLIENNSQDAQLTKSVILQTNLTEKVHWVKNGEEALDFIFGQGKYLGRKVMQMPRIIILTVNNEEVKGIEFLKTIKENPLTSEIFIISLSCEQETEIFADAINAGTNMCIAKTTNQQHFITQLNRELGYYWRSFEK